MIQNNIEHILAKNELIPVVTISQLNEVDTVYEKLKSAGISCIEITLRTSVSWDAIVMFKQKYGDEFDVGVGTVTSIEDINKCIDFNVDFIVTPGSSSTLIEALEKSKIAYLPGVSTPSEIIKGLNMGCTVFKFFPANLFGGINALKTYQAVFQNVKFCPTGGITEENYKEYLSLSNIVSVGGSWITK